MNNTPAPSLAQLPAAWSGLDVAKATFEAALYLPQPYASAPRPIPSLATHGFDRTPKGVEQWLAWCDRKLAEHARAQGLEQAPPLRACMEATGRYSVELAAWISQARPTVEPAIIDPLAASHYAKSLRMRNKTDRVDAAVLARMGYERRFDPTTPLPEPYATLRQLTRERDFLMGQLQAARLRGQEMEASPQLLGVHQVVITELKKAIGKVDRMINKHVASQPELAEMVRCLRTLPGVGRLTAVIILAELGDLRRYGTSRQVASFAGLNPKLFESGTSVKYESHLSKQGPSRARKVLYMSAMSVLRTQGPLRQHYDHLLAQGKCKMAALGVLMRKQLVLMRAVLVGQCDYDPSFVKQRPIATGAPACG
jgi:transposase